ncbi:hypothetical protein J9253_16940 [Thiothrix litoralis]|uniref:Uncharacterized protein n=1 Tax=Thiothrix litoralis TaxID=2891210 RepID=A0ABX7WPA8_9GAMM|nr:hypothetical protein [Thiothrix litoralis]QTR45671.1 hypothetical protein J9253_16940 [Thiothrix litoralis]
MNFDLYVFLSVGILVLLGLGVALMFFYKRIVVDSALTVPYVTAPKCH